MVRNTANIATILMVTIYSKYVTDELATIEMQ